MTPVAGWKILSESLRLVTCRKLLMPWARQYRQWQRDARLLEFTCQIPHQVFVSFLDVLMDKMG